MSPGVYQVVPHLGGALVTRSIQTEQTDVLANGLTVIESGKIQLEIVVARDAGHLSGIVLDSEEKPVAGSTVVLVPEPRLRSRSGLFRSCETDQNGYYEIQNVPPGKYSLLAWEDVEPGIWWDPAFLKDYEQKGEALTLKPSARESVKLHLTSLLQR